MSRSQIAFQGRTYTVVDLDKDSVFDYVLPFDDPTGEYKYRVLENIAYYSLRYRKWVLVEAGDKSDGATSAIDIESFGWIFHDELCATGLFSDGTKCNNRQASMVLSDILTVEGHHVRSVTWFIATWLFGGGKARDNGLW